MKLHQPLISQMKQALDMDTETAASPPRSVYGRISHTKPRGDCSFASRSLEHETLYTHDNANRRILEATYFVLRYTQKSAPTKNYNHQRGTNPESQIPFSQIKPNPPKPPPKGSNLPPIDTRRPPIEGKAKNRRPFRRGTAPENKPSGKKKEEIGGRVK